MWIPLHCCQSIHRSSGTFFKHVNTATLSSEHTSFVRHIFQTRGYHHTFVRAYLVGQVHFSNTSTPLHFHQSIPRWSGTFFKHVNTATHLSEHTSLVRYIFQTRGYRHTFIRAYLAGSSILSLSWRHVHYGKASELKCELAFGLSSCSFCPPLSLLPALRPGPLRPPV